MPRTSKEQIMKRKIKNRSGLTILDVVVTIVVLLVLAALLLPSVRRAREPARRSQCKSNLKQIGISLHNYHDVHKTFPPGWIAGEAPARSSGFGWGFSLLPFTDQEKLFLKFDSHHRLADTASGNSDLISTELSVYRCASDDGVAQTRSQWGASLGTTNYVGNFGVGIPATWSTMAGSEGKLVDKKYLQGMFGPSSSVRILDVKDGMSNVVLVGERRLLKEGVEWPLGKEDGSFNSYWAGIPNLNTVSPLSIVATATGGRIEFNGEDDQLPETGNLTAVTSPEGKQTLPLFAINKNLRLGVTLSGDGWIQQLAHRRLSDGSRRRNCEIHLGKHGRDGLHKPDAPFRRSDTRRVLRTLHCCNYSAAGFRGFRPG
jgi:type II secretory pathway pseudopilin PulG